MSVAFHTAFMWLYPKGFGVIPLRKSQMTFVIPLGKTR